MYYTCFVKFIYHQKIYSLQSFDVTKCPLLREYQYVPRFQRGIGSRYNSILARKFFVQPTTSFIHQRNGRHDDHNRLRPLGGYECVNNKAFTETCRSTHRYAVAAEQLREDRCLLPMQGGGPIANVNCEGLIDEFLIP